MAVEVRDREVVFGWVSLSVYLCVLRGGGIMNGGVMNGVVISSVPDTFV